MNVDIFRLRILIDAPLEDVWQAWTSPIELAKWFVQAQHDGPYLPGMGYRWTWTNGTDEMGDVIEANEPVRLAFTFGPDSGVEITLAPFEGRTVVDLRQTQTHSDPEERAEWCMDCRSGWTFYLANLKAWLENGIDLREHTATDIPDLANI
ncbi:hypothetical protein BH11ARM2_BH11ARM2_11800 [soil metagenome]